MAINHLTTFSDTTDGGGPYTTAAFTPTAGSYVCAFVVVSDSTTFGSSTAASSVVGTTLTRLSGQPRFGASAHSIHFFHMDQVATATSQTIAVSFSDAGTGCHIVVLEVIGVPQPGLAGIRQQGARSNGTDFTTVTWASSGVSNGFGAVVGCIGNVLNPAAVTPPTGWTEFADVGYATPDIGCEVAGIDFGGRTVSTTVSWGANVAAGGGYIVEFHGGVSGGTAQLGRRRRNWMRGRG